MKRFYSLLAIAVLAVAASATPIGAEVDSNPHATTITDVSCDNGATFEVVWGATEQDVVGHDLDTNLVGVAVSLWIADEDGNRLFPIWQRPGRGLAAISTWCWWPAPESPSGFAGIDVVFNANER